MPRQHRLIDGGDLVRERFDQRRVHREHGIEEMRQADAVGFRDEAKELSIAVEAPRPPHLNDFKTRFVVPVKDLVGDPAVQAAIHESQSVRSVPGYADNGNRSVGKDAADSRVRLKIFESQSDSPNRNRSPP